MGGQARSLATLAPLRRSSSLARVQPYALLLRWLERRRARRDLARLLRVGPYMIADIGLDLAAVEAEIEKPFWQD